MSKTDTALPFDYSAYVDERASDQEDVLGRISVLADKMHDLDKELAQVDMQMKRLKEQRRQISEEQLPELFERVGMQELKTRSGLPLKMKERVHTNVSKDRKPAAIAWLDENGHGGMVKRNVIIEFDKTQADKVEALFRLIGRGWPNHRQELDVHASTVKAFVTQQLKDGKEIPLDTFGVHCVNVVEISSK